MDNTTKHSCGEAPDYLKDRHLSVGTKEYLKVLNASDKPVESLGVQGARDVLTNAQNAVNVDLSGIEESEKTITIDNFTVKLTIVRPEGVTGKLPVFMFVHGGGWVLGDYPTHKRLVRDLVVESGFVAVFVNYTPSPEAHFPVAINEIYAATKWVAENGHEINVDSSRMGIVGNSVGGNMSAVTSLMAKENGGPHIRIQILMWPVTDALHFDWGSYQKYGEQRFLTSSLMKWMFDNYTKDPVERENIHLSILEASIDDLRGLPPTLIEVAENDILRDQGEALGRKLDEAGVDVTTLRFNGVTHDWGLLNGFATLSPVRTLITVSAATLKKYLSDEVIGKDYFTKKDEKNIKKEGYVAATEAGTAVGSAVYNAEKDDAKLPVVETEEEKQRAEHLAQAEKDKLRNDKDKQLIEENKKAGGCGCQKKKEGADNNDIDGEEIIIIV